ncbi:hypothetical protein HNR44_002706 [Geomicrobium halophilum]|uniref:Uncharacterized protein n=1 Tax=Geomicrobium halophilum TaxID=549000 RepID=A0A841PU86_9BACL|nr:hypothetical protein [Geomicrobium halophilum]
MRMGRKAQIIKRVYPVKKESRYIRSINGGSLIVLFSSVYTVRISPCVDTIREQPTNV